MYLQNVPQSYSPNPHPNMPSELSLVPLHDLLRHPQYAKGRAPKVCDIIYAHGLQISRIAGFEQRYINAAVLQPGQSFTPVIPQLMDFAVIHTTCTLPPAQAPQKAAAAAASSSENDKENRPFSLNQANAAKAAIESKQIDPEQALHLYHEKYVKLGHGMPQRNIKRYEHIGHNDPEARNAMLHMVPEQIIRNLHKLRVVTRIFTDAQTNKKYPGALIPCSITALPGCPAGKDYEIQHAVLEIGLSWNGKPIHLFARPCDNKRDGFLKEKFGESKEALDKIKFERDFPSLTTAQQVKQTTQEAWVSERIPFHEDVVKIKAWSPFEVEWTFYKK